jgi:hypothetical protein
VAVFFFLFFLRLSLIAITISLTMSLFPANLPLEMEEAIFLQMELPDLLRAQRVCRTWKIIIDTSPSLQQKLFFKPATYATPIFNPLLMALHPDMFPIDEARLVCGPNLAWVGTSREDAVLRGGASWQRMFPVQPPPKLDQIIIQELRPCNDDARTISGGISPWLECPQSIGIRMGWLYRITVHERDRSYAPEASGWHVVHRLRWNMFPPTEAKPKDETEGSEAEPEADSEPQNTVTLMLRNVVHICGARICFPPRPAGLQVAPLPPGLLEYDDPAYAWT